MEFVNNPKRERGRSAYLCPACSYGGSLSAYRPVAMEREDIVTLDESVTYVCPRCGFRKVVERVLP